MKAIITGATGFIGQGVLSRLISHPSITSIILFSRRPLKPEVYFTSSKVKIVQVNDFENYSEAVIDEITDAEACFWCMGSNDPEKPVNLDYPCYFVGVVGKIVRERQEGGKRFRYVHVGGALTLRDQQASAWFLGETRRLRGLAETKALDVASEEWAKGKWETIVVKPGGVMGAWPMRDMFLGKLTGSNIFVHRNELAATMVDVAVNGYDDGTEGNGKTIYNKDIITKGREVLSRE